MICPKCKSTILEKAAFCPNCGEKLTENTEQNKKFCPSCGGEAKESDIYCAKCGARIAVVTQLNPYTASYSNTSSSGKITGSYYVSVISAMISLIIRSLTQQELYTRGSWLDGRMLLGIDDDLKPFFSAIPAIAAIIVSLLIVSDNNTSSQKKATAFIINIVFIALAVLCIWFDVPYDIY